MTNKKPNRRARFRLRVFDRIRIDAMAQQAAVTRTEFIIKLLTWLVHNLQTGRVNAPTRQLLTREYFGRTTVPEHQSTHLIDCRLPIIILDYLKFNGYKLTTCLLYALDHGEEAIQGRLENAREA